MLKRTFSDFVYPPVFILEGGCVMFEIIPNNGITILLLYRITELCIYACISRDINKRG